MAHGSAWKYLDTHVSTPCLIMNSLSNSCRQLAFSSSVGIYLGWANQYFWRLEYSVIWYSLKNFQRSSVYVNRWQVDGHSPWKHLPPWQTTSLIVLCEYIYLRSWIFFALGPHDLSISLLLLLTVRGLIHHSSWNVQAWHGWRLKTWEESLAKFGLHKGVALAPFVRPYNKEAPSMSLQVHNSLLFTQLIHSWNSWPVSQCFGPWLEQQLSGLPMYRLLRWIDYGPQTTITSATLTSIGKTEIVL